jgi:ankyrin repeat protein
MKKVVFLASLAVMTFSVSGMIGSNPNDQDGNRGSDRKRTIQQVDGENESDQRQIRAGVEASDASSSVRRGRGRPRGSTSSARRGRPRGATSSARNTQRANTINNQNVQAQNARPGFMNGIQNGPRANAGNGRIDQINQEIQNLTRGIQNGPLTIRLRVNVGNGQNGQAQNAMPALLNGIQNGAMVNAANVQAQNAVLNLLNEIQNEPRANGQNATRVNVTPIVLVRPRANAGNGQNGQAQNARPGIINGIQNGPIVNAGNGQATNIDLLNRFLNGQRANGQNGQAQNARPNFLDGILNGILDGIQHGRQVARQRLEGFGGDISVFAWFNAVNSNNLNEMRRLFSEGLGIRMRSPIGKATALHIASQNGNLDLVRWLLDYDVDSQGMVQFLLASRRHIRLSNEDILILRNRTFPDRLNIVNAVDRSGRTPLFFGIENNHPEIVRYLTEHGADVNVADINGSTSLMFAALNDNLEMVQHLTEHGANINAATYNSRWTSLLVATESGHLRIVRYLTEHGANVNATDHNRWTPLMFAVKEGYTEIAQHLIERGANVNATDNNGDTPLMIAAMNRREDIVRHLASLPSVDVNARSSRFYRDLTALGIARRMNQTNIIRILGNAGATE